MILYSIIDSIIIIENLVFRGYDWSGELNKPSPYFQGPYTLLSKPQVPLLSNNKKKRRI